MTTNKDNTHKNLKELNTVQTTESSWRDFVEYSIGTDFYKRAIESTQDIQRAIDLTLLSDYLDTFSSDEKKKILEDRSVFMQFAQGFVSMLSETRFSHNGYNKTHRAYFLGMIKRLLQEQKDSKGMVEDRERFLFYRSIVRFCSSVEYVTKVYEDYKSYLKEISAPS